MPAQLVTVFGGTGFLGRRIVRHLYDAGFAVRSASRHPDRTAMTLPDARPRLRSVHCDMNEDKSVAVAISDAYIRGKRCQPLRRAWQRHLPIGARQGGRARGTTCPRGWRSKVAPYLRDRRRLPVTVALHPQQRGG